MNVKFTSDQVLQPDGKAILTGFFPNYLWVNGKKTSKTEGTKFTVAALPNFDKITVKVTAVSDSPISKADLLERNLSGNFVWVSFSGFEAHSYFDTRAGTDKIAATATGITIEEE